jgi:uncharacterized protein (DUF2225 family)
MATSSKRVETTCPVCQTVFSASMLMSTNNFGGYDSDLCPHAMGSSPMHIRIWGCPECHFSGFADDFEQKFNAKQQQELRKWLSQTFKVVKSSDEKVYDTFPSYLRYEIAAELAAKNDAPALTIARLYLHAAWCCRNIGIISADSDLPEEMRLNPEKCPSFFKALDQAKVAPSRNRAENLLLILEKTAEDFPSLSIPEAELAASYLNLGQLLRSTGENAAALQWLEKAAESEPAYQKLVAAVKNSIEQEKAYQLKAVSWFEKTLAAGKLAGPQKQETLIMLAESYRRTGANESAIATYLQLFDEPVLPPFITDLVSSSFERMGCLDKFPKEKVLAAEKKLIAEAMQAIEDPAQCRDAAMFLSTVRDRKEIFPKLAKLFSSDNPELVDAALTAMSDDTPEAVKLLMELFAKEDYTDAILGKMENLNTPIPAQPLLKLFNEVEPENLPDYLMRRLTALQDQSVKEALLARAEKVFNVEAIKNLSVNKPKVYKEEDFLRSLIISLSASDSLRPLPLLQRIVENAHVEGYNFGNKLVEEAGAAIEFIINCHLGFSVVTTRKREPQFEQADRNIIGEPFKNAKANLRDWLEKNAARPYREIVLEGFAKAGYRVLPESDPACLKELIEGLSDQFYPVRYHSYRELERRTGISYRPFIGRNPEAYPIDFRNIVWFYTSWLDKNEKNLVYNESSAKFEVKESE